MSLISPIFGSKARAALCGTLLLAAIGGGAPAQAQGLRAKA